MSEDIERALKHGGRLRANEIRPKIAELGFEKGVIACLEALAARDSTLHQEVQQTVQAVMMLSANVEQLVNVLGIHGTELTKLKGLDRAVANTHPDESN